MTKKITRFLKRFPKRLRHKVKQCLYRFLVAVHEGEIRISFFYIVCTMFLLFLGIGFFFKSDYQKETSTTASVFGSELTHALHYAADYNHRAELDADITLFLLPDTADDEALSSFLDAPLYGFYLTGKELMYLPEYYASLSESFVAGTPYIGGLSFSYNPKRIIYNRATDISLFTKEGHYTPISEDSLYYVIGTESVFSMFHYLSERTYQLLKIQPKDMNGTPLSDYSNQLLRGAVGSYSFADIYKDYLLYASGESNPQNACEILRCNSLNTGDLFYQTNIAGYFIIGSVLLLFALTALVRPYLRRVNIWFRLFLFHRKKRGKVTLRTRIFAAKATRRRVA